MQASASRSSPRRFLNSKCVIALILIYTRVNDPTSRSARARSSLSFSLHCDFDVSMRARLISSELGVFQLQTVYADCAGCMYIGGRS